MLPKVPLKNTKKESNVKEYACWGCKTTYQDPADFLWHIQNCRLAKK